MYLFACNSSEVYECVCVTSWLLLVCPIYWSKALHLLHPYASLVHGHTLNMFYILCRAMQPIGDWCEAGMNQLFITVSCHCNSVVASSVFSYVEARIIQNIQKTESYSFLIQKYSAQFLSHFLHHIHGLAV